MIDETVEEIREMQTHSSSVVAVKAARALEDLLERDFASVEDFERDLERNSSALRRANPSHASLVTTQRAIVSMVEDADAGTAEEAKAGLSEAIDNVVEQVETAKRRAAENAVDFVEDGATILTHDYSSTVLEAIEQAVSDGRYVTVYVTEARPRYLGRKTARALAEMDRVDAHLVVDGASGHYLPECDRVLLGMDCIVDDTLYNRIGTFPLAAAADQTDVPVTVVGSSAKLVGEGFRFENDFRSPSEVLREPAEGFSVENPAYDATPTDLLDSVVTDEGVREF
ncbi:translation initiation factor eIF-2B [Halorussus lipolyticus]|uniref:translation initiation factor eIF-2B n=1 Tax=Halorussus lipolyticus TaxID=3034024 RepID=UPI0023E8D252|nr:translation initiation factor eIF-2B [Halorussus sp. DT80]